MSKETARRVSLRRLAWCCAALVLAITTLSAFIRLSASGLGCAPWPQCYGQALRDKQQGTIPAASGAVTAARIAHRVTAVAALLLIIAMLMKTLAQSPSLRNEGRMVLGLLFLALFLAVLGRWTGTARAPAVVLGNLLAGFAMVALSLRLSLQLTPGAGPPPDGSMARWARWAAALLVLQVALGGMVNALHAGLSCPELMQCDLSGASWRSLEPWREPGFDAGDASNAAGALVHWLHRLGALAALAVVLPLGIVAWRRGRRAGAAVLGLLLLEVVLGAGLVLAGLPLFAALAHNVVAALLLAAVVDLAAGTARAPAST